MTWEEEYEIEKAKREEYAQKHGLSQPDPFFGPRQMFGIDSGAVRVTDPCYSVDTWCAGTLEDVRNGVWYGWSRNVADDWSWEVRLDDLVEKDYNPGILLTDEEIVEVILQMTKDGKNDDEIITSDFYEENIGDNPWLNMAVAAVHVVYSDLGEVRQSEFKYLLDVIKHSKKMHHREKSPHEIFQSLKDKVCGWRQAMITVVHEDYQEDTRFSNENILDTVFKLAEVSKIDVGVDSGQAGIFDLELFIKYAASENHSEDTPEHDRFYDACCDIAADEESYRRINKDKADIVVSSGSVEVDGHRFGYNSSSGEGDGSYTLRFIKDSEGKVIMMNIMFMTPEEYYSEDEGDEDE